MKKTFVILLFFVLSVSFLKAQADCPPTINEPNWQQPILSVFQPYAGGNIWGNVQIRYRQINSQQFEVKVNWNTLDNMHYYGITDEELKQMMYKAVMTDVLGENCSFSGTILFTFYEETQCFVRKKCYLKIAVDRDVLCADQGWPGPDPMFYEYQNVKYLQVNRDVPCGMQCCQYNYIVECIPNPAEESQNYIHILSFGKTPYPGSECETSTNTDCLNGEFEPCESTCE